ncbi:hypothetical protein BDK51DRAFT_50507, partial [Blyttiomyces helicus]
MKNVSLILSTLAATATASPVVLDTTSPDAFSVAIARHLSNASPGARAKSNLPVARARFLTTNLANLAKGATVSATKAAPVATIVPQTSASLTNSYNNF